MAERNNEHVPYSHPHQQIAEDTIIGGGIGATVGQETGFWIADKVAPFLGRVVGGSAGSLVEATSDLSIVGISIIFGALSGGLAGYSYATRHSRGFGSENE